MNLTKEKPKRQDVKKLQESLAKMTGEELSTLRNDARARGDKAAFQVLDDEIDHRARHNLHVRICEVCRTPEENRPAKRTPATHEVSYGGHGFSVPVCDEHKNFYDGQPPVNLRKLVLPKRTE